ncbi:hypothetical protein KEH51_09085 [[Brevibacterium] frigoritolerans]|uniref:Uncharacterized protein n=1 Tax=Peribacillus frigoritolerans TaxID=450367 RepID=A0A941FI13_9BACI|nr:hypothetical protein [Peribacillus frigoritolerans]
MTEYNYQFTGESEHWEAVYFYEGTELWGEKTNKPLEKELLKSNSKDKTSFCN